MSISAPEQQPAARTPQAPGPRRGTHRAPREIRGLALAIAVLAIASLVVFADALATRGRIFSGVAVAGVDLGGKTPAEAEALLVQRAEELGGIQLRFPLDDRVVTTTPDELGWSPDPAATAATAMRVGRDGPWSRVWDRARGMLGSITAAWEASLDRDAYARVIGEWDELLGDPPREGSVRAVDGEILATQPSSGRGVDRDAVLQTLRTAVVGEPVRTVELASVPVQPLTTIEDVDAAKQDVERALSAPIRVRIRDVEFSVRPNELAPMIRTVVDSTREGARLRLALRTAQVEDLLDPYRRRFEVPARDAEFVAAGKKARIRPSRPGRELGGALAAAALARIALSNDREGRIGLVESTPALTTEEAEDLSITERVSTFTTYYPPGEPRVTNIHLGAEVLHGAIVRPGETFSLNERLGQRTLDEGYVVAPAIVDGKFDEQVGGGISQLTTTAFNAAFFAGYPFLEYQAHSYYFDRYPLGREATLSWPSPDLVFRNDTGHAAYVATSTSSTSVTVSIYSTSTREVEATDPEVVSETKFGYTVVLERVVRKGGEVVRRDSFRTYYRDPSLAEQADTKKKRKHQRDEQGRGTGSGGNANGGSGSDGGSGSGGGNGSGGGSGSGGGQTS